MSKTEEHAGSEPRSETKSTGKRGTGYRNEIAMGFAVILTVLLVFFGVRYLEDQPLFKGTYDLFAEFESAGGIVTGSLVKISGVRVGEVTRVQLMESSRGVSIRMEIEDDVVVPEGSTASIEGISALDNVGIGIKPGRAGNPPLSDGDTLQSLPSADLIGQVDSTLIDARRTFREAGTLISSTEQDLGVVLGNMRTASGDAAVIMEDSRARLRATLVELQAAADDLNRFATRMDYAAVDLNQVTGPGGDTLVTAINRLNAIMHRLDGVVASLERGSTNLETVAARMESGDGTFGRMLNDPSLYTRLDSAAMRLDELLRDFKDDPERYLKHLELIDVF